MSTDVAKYCFNSPMFWIFLPYTIIPFVFCTGKKHSYNRDILLVLNSIYHTHTLTSSWYLRKKKTHCKQPRHWNIFTINLQTSTHTLYVCANVLYILLPKHQKILRFLYLVFICAEDIVRTWNLYFILYNLLLLLLFYMHV